MGLLVAGRFLDDGERLVEILGLHVHIAGAQAELDAGGAAFDGHAGGAGHDRGERLGAAHAAEAGSQDPLARQITPIVAAPHLHERLVGALHDALRADVDPRAGRHLAVHHEALAVELVEVLPVGPARYEVGVCDEHARRVGVSAEHAHRLARLDEQRLVGLQTLERGDDAVEALPVARGAADAAVDHELAGLLGHVRIEVVHQHAQGRFSQPALGIQLGAARGANDAGVVDAGHGEVLDQDFERAKPMQASRMRVRVARMGAAWASS